MTLKNACFISYAHGQGKHVGPLVEAMREELMSQLEMYCPEEVYLDKDRLKPGFEYNESLATAICESACMVLAFAPIYAEREYCRREFAAMEQLEKQRKALLGNKARGHRFIIPVLFAGQISDLPDSLKRSAHACDISPFTLSSHGLRRNTKFSKALEPVCKGILAAAKLLKDCHTHLGNTLDCTDFILPDRAPRWAPIAPLPFPGREVAP